jgi:hypothetical protein
MHCKSQLNSHTLYINLHMTKNKQQQQHLLLRIDGIMHVIPKVLIPPKNAALGGGGAQAPPVPLPVPVPRPVPVPVRAPVPVPIPRPIPLPVPMPVRSPTLPAMQPAPVRSPTLPALPSMPVRAPPPRPQPTTSTIGDLIFKTDSKLYMLLMVADLDDYIKNTKGLTVCIV